MESERFDSLIRGLAEAVPSQTRRSTAGLMLGGLLAGLLATGSEEADARTRRRHVTAEQKKGKKTKGGKKDKKKDKKDDQKCGNGQQRCGDSCVNIQTDRNNCGSCGRICTELEDCLNGGCFGCSDPLTKCGDECFDITSSNQHCGGCNRPCGVNEQCINGFCTCAGPRCLRGDGERRCCPATGGTCCVGGPGTCCPAGQFCTTAGGCCPNGTYLCPDQEFCCPTNQFCRGGGRCSFN